MLSAITLADTATVVVGVFVSLVGAAGVSAKFRAARPIKWLIERLIIEPAGEAVNRHVDARVTEAVTGAIQPLTEQVNRLGHVVHAIHYEMFPNTGTSMRDAIDRTEGTTIMTQGQVEALQVDVVAIRDRTARLEGNVEILKGRELK